MIAIVLVGLLAWFVVLPLLRSHDEVEVSEGGEDPERADLEAHKEATYRQIRDAEIDHKQGKLSDGDWERTDNELRAEAIEILKRLDKLDKADKARLAERARAAKPDPPATDSVDR